jgi:microcystin degradation protein MlrC
MEQRTSNRRSFIRRAGIGCGAAGFALTGPSYSHAATGKRKRIMVGTFSDETNTFIPRRRTLDETKRSARYGKDAIPRGGFVDACKMYDVELIGSISAGGNNSLMNADVFDYVTGVMLDTLDKNQVDGVYLNLHGGGCTEGHDDLEGETLALIRKKVGPDIPIAFSLDMHCDLTPLEAQSADMVSIGFHYPQYDRFEYAQAAGWLLMGTLFGKIKPVIAIRKLPLMIGPPLNVRTASEPIQRVYARALEIQRTIPGILGVNPAHGFMQQDIPTQGAGVAVTADRDRDLAQKYADEVGELFFSFRKEYWVHLPQPEEAIKRALKSTRPVAIADGGDNMGAGGAGDGAHFLREILRQNVKSAIVQIYDTEAAQKAAEKGEGATVTLDVGGKSDPIYGPPVSVTGKVIQVKWNAKKTNPAVQLEVNGMTLVLNPPSKDLREMGIFPEKYRMTVNKVGHEHGPSYPEDVFEIMAADAPGWTTTILDSFTWKRIPRPMYPLDKI